MVMRAGRNVTVRGDVLGLAGSSSASVVMKWTVGVVVRNLRSFTQLTWTGIGRGLITIAVSSRSS
jgi:hypothetical protein